MKVLRDNRESLLAVINVGASSAYWLGLAFTLTASEYGRMMTLQAAVLLVATAFTLRTHDLVYFLAATHRYPLRAAFRTSLRVEVTAMAVATLVTSAGATTLYWGDYWQIAMIAVLALMAGLATLQGAAMAKLRSLERSDLIMRADLVCVAAWGLAGSSILLLHSHVPVTLLIIGTLPPVARTAALLVAAFRCHTPETGAPVEQAAPIAGFLAGGQTINLIKNGATSMETMILAAFCAPAWVALYRLAKSTLAPATAASNVAFQKSYHKLSQTHGLDKLSVLKDMQLNATRLCAFMYPLSAGFALVYALSKPDVDILPFQMLTAGVFIAFLPTVLMQGAFVILSQHGDFRHANVAYLLSLAVLATVSAALFAWPSVWVVVIAVVAAGFARFWYMSLAATRLLARTQLNVTIDHAAV